MEKLPEFAVAVIQGDEAWIVRGPKPTNQVELVIFLGHIYETSASTLAKEVLKQCLLRAFSHLLP